MFNKLLIDASTRVFDNANMVETRANPPIYDALVALKPDGLSLNAWTVKAGVARSMFNEIRRHGNPTSETLQKLLDVIGVSFAQFDASLAPVMTEVRSAGLVGDREIHRAFHGEAPKPKMPLLGSAMGGEYGDMDEQIEMTELHMCEVLEYLSRPASMASDQDAYALTIVGDSMAPRFEPGERVAVSPKASIGIGDDVIVQLRGEDGEDERIKLVLIKRLARRSVNFIELRQFNPDTTFRIEAKRIAAIHKVAGRLF